MKTYKQYIALFYLIFFIGIKSVGLHAFAHSDTEFDNDCDVCEFTISSKKVPFIKNQQFELKELSEHNHQEKTFVAYTYQFTQQQIDNTLFCRPPPVI